MTSRRRWLIAVAVALAVGGLVLLLLRPEPAAPEARDSATQACREVVGFLDAVQRNGPADAALDRLDRAVVRGRAASSTDPAWVSLASGIESVRLAVRQDDRGAARVGVAVVRAECARLGLDLPTAG